MNRKRTTAVGAAGVAMILLAACGSGDAGDGDASTASAMYTWVSNESDREQWQAFITAAQEKDPEFDLSLEGPSFADYWTTVRTRMNAAGAPCIITTQAARAQELSEILLPLDDLAEKHGLDLGAYNSMMIEGMTVDGTVRAIPYDAEPTVLYYNKDLFAAAGLEEPGTEYTSDQFVQDAIALTGDGVYGLAVPSLFSGGPAVPLAFANGNYPVSDGELTLTDPGFVEDVQFTFDLVTDPGFVEDVQFTFDLVAEHGVATPPQSGDPADTHIQKFSAGSAAMIIDGPWFYETLVSQTDAEVGIAVVPSESGTPEAMIQGSGFGIAQSCDDPDAAFQNIMKITTPEVVGAVGRERGTVPSIEESVSAWAEGKPAQDVAVVEALLASGAPLVTTPSWNQVETLFSQYSSDGYRGNRTAEDLLTTIQDSAS